MNGFTSELGENRADPRARDPLGPEQAVNVAAIASSAIKRRMATSGPSR
jgi:hypothetical protein